MTKVVTGKVRFSFPHLFSPSAMEGQAPKYSVQILIPKSDKETIGAIHAAVEQAKQEGIAKFGGKIPAILKTPLRDGDQEKPDRDEYIGHYFLSASSKTRPGVVDKHRNIISDETDVYAGCFGRVSLNFYAFNQSGNKGVACGLNNVQKLEDGESFGGKPSAFADFGDEDDDFLS
jgi:hypothetical protein